MKLIKLFSILLIIASCRSTKDTSIPKTVPPLLPGFTLIASPNSLDKPGSVIAVDKKGIPQYLGSVDVSSLEKGVVQPAEATGKRASSVSALINFLGMDKYSVDANVDSKFNKTFEYKISLKDCSQERIPLLDINKELENMKQAIKTFSTTNDMADYKYYIITDAVKAKQISYEFGGDKVGDIDLKANIQKIIDVNPKVNWENKAALQLDYNLQEPLYVYAKYWSLNVQSQITGGTIFKIGDVVKEESPIHEKSK